MSELSKDMKKEIKHVLKTGIDTIWKMENRQKDLVNDFMITCQAELYQLCEEIDDCERESAAIQLGTMYKNVSEKHDKIKRNVKDFSCFTYENINVSFLNKDKIGEEEIQKISEVKSAFDRTIELVIQIILGTDDIKLFHLIVIKDIIAGMINGCSAYINFDTE